MILFDNLEDKLRQIKDDKFYSPYIEKLKEKYLEYIREEIPLLTYKDFMYFYETGSRVEFEDKYFSRRERLNCAYLLYLIYGDEKYIDEISGCIWAICTEISWALPAHLDVYPMGEHRTQIDIFAAETAFGLAEIYFMIGDKLPVRIQELILHELEERTFGAYEQNSFWWETLKSNWAAVCAGSIGMAYMCVAPERFANVRERLMKTIESYLTGFGDDGCCQEGITYWDYGFSFFTMFADMLFRFTDGKCDIRHSEKIDNIALCNQRLILRKDATISFSDGSRRARFYNIGLYSYLKDNYNGITLPEDISWHARSHRYLLGKVSSIALRMFLWSKPEHYADKENNCIYEMRYFEDTKWYINKKEKYSFAAKAGHNAEEHNHNDVGSFIFADDSGQVLVDIGAMEYTRQNFRNETRYTLLQNSSLGHSVPIIDGCGQGFGEKFCGEVTAVSGKEFSLEMQKAYECQIEKIARCFTMEEDGIVLTDRFEYRGEHNIVERFISMVEPEVCNEYIKIGNVMVKSDTMPKIESRQLVDKNIKKVNVYLIDYHVKGKKFVAEIVIA